MTSYDRDRLEAGTLLCLEMLWSQWDRPEFTGSYPSTIRMKLGELVELVKVGLPAGEQRSSGIKPLDLTQQTGLLEPTGDKAGVCPRCGRTMSRRGHLPTWRPKSQQKYWFAYWDVCSCGMVQHYEKAKVHAVDLVERAKETENERANG